jgi:hypothetical protein
MPEGGFAAGQAAHRVESGIGAVGFHLIDDLEEAAEFAFGPATLREPLQVFRRQIVDGEAARREMIRTEFAERHVETRDVREIGGHVIGKELFHAGERVAAWLPPVKRRLGRGAGRPMGAGFHPWRGKGFSPLPGRGSNRKCDLVRIYGSLSGHMKKRLRAIGARTAQIEIVAQVDFQCG